MLTDTINVNGENKSLKDAYELLEEQTEHKEPNPPKDENKEDGPGEAEEQAEQDPDYIDAITDTAFAVLDSAQTTVFKIMAHKKCKKRANAIDAENGFARLMQLRAEKEANSNARVEVINTYSGNDAKLVQLDATIDAFISNLGFSEKQMAMMRPGLRMMVKKNAGKIPPELLFYAGLATAIAGNVAEYYQL